MTFSNNAYDIIILAGQSNAEGNGESLNNEPIRITDAYELIDKNPYGMKFKEDGSYDSLDFVYPIEMVVRQLQERRSGHKYYYDLSLQFAYKYKIKFLEKNRKVLVVKAAYGGTGFALHQQGVGNPLFNRMIDMIDYALSLNKENRIVAFLWHQGEHDAFENPSFTYQQRYDFYYNNLLKQFIAIRKRYSCFSFPLITGGICDEWRKDYLKQCDAIEAATAEVCKEISNASFVKANGLKSNNQEIQNGDTIHFSKKALMDLGNRYFKAFAAIKVNS